ncbi:Veg family protein [[Clostridium] polysaccharolyticum]|jgi:uncharacterized protein Veg|uniref:Uncharacterized protein Veg n=1 Tax=[Clostridium] polysaccharolyticum TaxID=29364 RepID=A0A1I0FYM6_9FIRM|nr:Veg family protein [[Clostridium] polysaccharolyticum]SET63417.1 Uncharacterized protein Veg [[Clostridium] polysaccharolyticum]
MKQLDLKSVRRAVDSHIGSRVRIRSNRGRHRVEVAEGIISETYPSIFTIQLVNYVDEGTKTMSVSYADILTKEVQLMLCS